MFQKTYNKYTNKSLYICRKKMLEITEGHYRKLAAILAEAISEADFFNGSVEMEEGDHRALLRTTLIVKRTPRRDPADRSERATDITEIIPVWWEYHLYSAEGERLTDFDWREMMKFILQ